MAQFGDDRLGTSVDLSGNFHPGGQGRITVECFGVEVLGPIANPIEAGLSFVGFLKEPGGGGVLELGMMENDGRIALPPFLTYPSESTFSDRFSISLGILPVCGPGKLLQPHGRIPAFTLACAGHTSRIQQQGGEGDCC
jgi:hypothetical protein